jgi:hypothetical protein
MTENFVTLQDLVASAKQVFSKWRNDKRQRKAVVMLYWKIRTDNPSMKVKTAAQKTGELMAQQFNEKETKLCWRTVLGYVKEFQ